MSFGDESNNKKINALFKMETATVECLGQLSETHQKVTYQLSWWVIAPTVKIFIAV